MNFPFSEEQFLKVFENYNINVWPTQFIMNLLAILTVTLTLLQKKSARYLIPSILSFFWLWMGMVYHIIYFSVINKAAYLFGILYILQALLFIYFGLYKKRLSFQFRSDVFGITGAIFILYALVGYPLIGYTLNHVYPQSPTFGLPCPTTIFTFGIFLWSKHISFSLLAIPLLWSLIGFSAALNFGMKEDFGLLVSGITSFIMILIKQGRTNIQQVSIPTSENSRG